MNAWAVRLMFALNAPQRPRSAVMTSNRMRSSERISRSGCDTSSNREVKLPRTLFNCSAYGRALNTRSCARRSLAAETVFIAFVSCCVFLTERMRRRISNRLGITLCGAAFPALELFLVVVDGFLHFRLDLVI